MRLFIAVPIDARVRSAARRLMGELRSSEADFKWVEPENLHLTLAFLGETGEDRLPELGGILDRAAAARESFELTFNSLGAFDSFDYPRVVWVGLGMGAEPLQALAGALCQALYDADLLPEPERRRRFEAHLTLGRMRSARGIARLRSRLKSAPPLEPFSCAVERLVLYRSRLSPKGPSYTALREARLGARPSLSIP